MSITFELLHSDASNPIRAICKKGSTYFMASDDVESGSGSKIQTSSNLTDWTTIGTIADVHVNVLYVWGDTLYALCSDRVLSSSDGTTWTKVISEELSHLNFYSICEFNDMLFVGADLDGSDSSRILYSTDGVSFSSCFNVS